MTDRPNRGLEPTEMPQDPEDLKIITLARSALARAGAAQAACLRDTDGRTYAGSRVELDHLDLTAVQVVVAMAVSSGAQGVEAVAVAGSTDLTEDDRGVVGDLAALGTGPAPVAIWITDAGGHVQDRQLISGPARTPGSAEANGAA